MNVLMPQMGESVAEGTIVRWIKKVGDKVDRDEPLFEISTDKVDAEIPSPAAGILSDPHRPSREQVNYSGGSPLRATTSPSAGSSVRPDSAHASRPPSML